MQFVIGAIKEMVEPRGIRAVVSRSREASHKCSAANAPLAHSPLTGSIP